MNCRGGPSATRAGGKQNGLVALFLFVVVPLTYLGAAAGFSKETIEWPARASKIERPIPPQPATLSLPVSALVCGVVPFGASFVELYFVLDSLWMEAYYYLAPYR